MTALCIFQDRYYLRTLLNYEYASQLALMHLLGSHIIGMKYAKAWRVFTTLNIQNGVSLYHLKLVCFKRFLRIRGPLTGSRGRVTGNVHSRSPRTMNDRIRRDKAMPNLSISGGRQIGRMRPPTEVPAKTIPFAVPLLFSNHSAMNERQGAYSSTFDFVSDKRTTQVPWIHLHRGPIRLLGRERDSRPK